MVKYGSSVEETVSIYVYRSWGEDGEMAITKVIGPIVPKTVVSKRGMRGREGIGGFIFLQQRGSAPIIGMWCEH